MKKVISVLMIGAVFSSVALADDLDNQIQRLEKENKLLELQKKKKELQEQTQQTNQSQSNQDNAVAKTKAPKVKNPNSKNGFFVGVEGTLGGSRGFLEAKATDSVNKTNDTDAFMDFSSTTFDLGLMGGYQHYFGQSQRHGIKVSAHLYSGFGNSWDISHDFSQENGVKTTKGTISYIPIKFGLDVKYLWDFLQRGKHTLGFNVGLGYEFDYYMSGKLKTEGYGTTKLDNFFSGGIYPLIGLHYYYGRHQIELLYRFGGIFTQGVTKTLYLSEDDTSKLENKIVLDTQSYLTLNYAYRF